MRDLSLYTKRVVKLTINSGACSDNTIHGEYVGMLMVVAYIDSPPIYENENDILPIGKVNSITILIMPCKVGETEKESAEYFIIKDTNKVEICYSASFQEEKDWCDLYNKKTANNQEYRNKILTDINSELLIDKLDKLKKSMD